MTTKGIYKGKLTAKLSWEDISNIRQRILLNPIRGYQRKLAIGYAVSDATISYIKSDSTWQNLQRQNLKNVCSLI